MFKDYKKYLSTSVQVYLFLLVIIFIMKLIGLDYFGLDTNNKLILYLSNLVTTKQLLNNIIYILPLMLNHYILLSISANDNTKKMKIYNLILAPIFFVFECFKLKLFGNFAFIGETLYFLIVLVIYTKKIDKEIIKRFISASIAILLVQIISIVTRTNTPVRYISNPIFNIILNLDYIVLLVLVHKLYFMKGDGKLCGYQEVQSSSSQKKRVFSDLLEKLQKNYSSFKRLNKQEKATIVIYLILSLIWNIFTLVAVFFIAVLNNTLVECIFIISAFWVSKKAFGKPFHLESMIGCFILSNTTYYVLNRVTTPIGISIIVPIMLGVGLSYVTSKFVRKKYFPLYKGMPEEEFENTILQVVKKNSDKYKICYDFFINKENAIFLGRKYNYTEAGIRKITSRVNDKIKALK